MLRNLFALGFGIALFAPASADNFVANPQTTYLIDLDTPDQHMSEWRLTDVGSINALRATVKVNGLIAPSGEIKPGFMFTFINGDENATFYVFGNWKDQTLLLSLQHSRGGKDVADGGILMSSLLPNFKVGKPFELAIDWTAEGKLTATVSGYTKLDGTPGQEGMTIKMAAPPKQIAVDSTTGEIELNTLKLGQSTP